jgi:hypothetical protein
MFRLPHIIIRLNAQPRARFADPGALKADRQIRADRGMAMHDPRQCLTGEA